MIRRALIIYCDNTPSDPLPGPVQDNANYRKFLTSYLGGEWHSSEIRSLQNPTKLQVEQARQNFMKGADYTSPFLLAMAASIRAITICNMPNCLTEIFPFGS